EPMLWVIPYGKGQVVTNVMGHENGKAVQCVGFITIMLRSCEWLATGKVTVPIPDNFPTAEKSSVVGMLQGPGDGYPAGTATAEGVACDLARAFMTLDSKLFRSA